jgi:hypothetical protein
MVELRCIEVDISKLLGDEKRQDEKIRWKGEPKPKMAPQTPDDNAKDRKRERFGERLGRRGSQAVMPR